jgi:hypothetical protein
MNMFDYSPKKAFENMFDFTFLNDKPKPPKTTTYEDQLKDVEDKLMDLVRSIAEEISSGLQQNDPEIYERWHDEDQPDDFVPNGYDYLQNVYDIKFIIDISGNYHGAELMVAGGGPNIYVETRDNTVRGYWGSTKAQWAYVDNIGLDDACEDYFSYNRVEK